MKPGTDFRSRVLAEVSHKRILSAVRDYYRAYEQRSRWVREDLLLTGELSKYERRLIEEWELVFDRAKDELGDEAAEELKTKMAKEIYAWVESADFPVRPRVREKSITRGSYHMLANSLRVGWHPDFERRLRAVLEAPEATP